MGLVFVAAVEIDTVGFGVTGKTVVNETGLASGMAGGVVTGMSEIGCETVSERPGWPVRQYSWQSVKWPRWSTEQLPKWLPN